MNNVRPPFAIPLLFIGLLLWSGCSGKDPEYQGRTVSGWVTALEDPDPEVKGTAVNTLMELAGKDPGVIQKIIQGMKSGNYAAAELLGLIGPGAGPQTAEVVQALGETLKSKGNLSTRLAAARALPKFGPATGPAVPAVIDALKDESAVIREMAAETLGKLPVDLGKQAIPALMGVAKHDVLSVQQKAVESLRILDPDALTPKR